MIIFRGMGINGDWFYGNLTVLTRNVEHNNAGHYISNAVGYPFAYPVRNDSIQVGMAGSSTWVPIAEAVVTLAGRRMTTEVEGRETPA